MTKESTEADVQILDFHLSFKIHTSVLSQFFDMHHVEWQQNAVAHPRRSGGL